MWRSIDSTARREATSPAAWPPMPSATTNRLCSLTIANESSFDLRLRPTSLRPALRIARRSASGTGFLLDPRLVAPRIRQLLQLRHRRLIGRLARQDGAELLDR